MSVIDSLWKLGSRKDKNDVAKRQKTRAMRLEALEDRQLLDAAGFGSAAALEFAPDLCAQVADDSGVIPLDEVELSDATLENACNYSKRMFYWDSHMDAGDWDYNTRKFNDKGPTADAIQKAASKGLNSMLWRINIEDAGASNFTSIDTHLVPYVKAVAALAKQYGIEVVPTVFATGYNTLQYYYDANLAEGLFVTDVPMKVSASTATFDPVAAGDFLVDDMEKWSGNVLSKAAFQDYASSLTYRSDVHHSGSSSLKFTYSSSVNAGNVTYKVTVKPDTYYRISVNAKSDTTDGTLIFQAYNTYGGPYYKQFTAYGETRREEKTTTWEKCYSNFFKVSAEGNEVDENGNVVIYISVGASLNNGSVYIDDVTLETAGFVDVIQRDGTPVTVTSADGKTVFQRGVDYEFESQLDTRTLVADGHNTDNSESVPLKLLSSRIKNEKSLRVSYYNATVLAIGQPQVATCLTASLESGYYADAVAAVQSILEPNAWFLSTDELRVAGTCEDCANSGYDMSQLLGRCITDQYNQIKAVNPNAEIFLWSDMIDPNFNATKDYYYVNGDLSKVVDYIPKDIIIACWFDEKSVKTADGVAAAVKDAYAFFANKGFRTLAAVYFDWGSNENTLGHMKAIDELISISVPVMNVGAIYTTWWNQYDYAWNLDPCFADLLPQYKTTKLTSIALSTTAPKAGTAVKATLSSGAATATYQWYRYERVAATGQDIWVPIAGATKASYTPTSADVGRKLKVITVGTGAYSGTLFADTGVVVKGDGEPDVKTLAKPTGLTSSVDGTIVALKWNAVADAAGYTVAYRVAGSGASFQTVNVTKNSAKLSYLNSYTQYEWKVLAKGDGTTKDSAYTTAVKFTTAAPSKLVKPAPLTLVVKGNTIEVSWKADPLATGYIVSYKKSADSTWTTKSATTNSYTLTGLDANTSYDVRVKGKGDNIRYVNSDYSDPSAATTATPSAIAKPTGLTSAVDGTIVTLKWNAVANAAGYTVAYRVAGSGASFQTVNVTKNSAKLSYLNSYTQYEWKVLAKGDGTTKDSAYATAVKFTTAAPSKLAKPDSPTLVVNGSSIEVSWKANSLATGYIVSYKKSAASTWTTKSATTNSYTLTGLDANTSYDVRVKAKGDDVCCANSDYSVPSAAKTATPSAIAKPTGLTSSVAGTIVTLKWNAVADAAGYTVAYRVAGSGSSFQTVKTTTNSVKLSYLNSYTQYEWKVFAQGDGAATKDSAYTTAVKFTTADPSKLAKPDSPTLVGNGSSIEVSWKANPLATGYLVSYQKSGDTKWTTKDATTNSYTLTGLAAGAIYNVRVKAKGDGVCCVNSDFSVPATEVVAVKLTKPGSFVVTPTGTSLVLEWAPVANASGYIVSYKKSSDTSWTTKSATGTSYKLTGLSASTSYDVRVKAKGDGVTFLNGDYCAYKTVKTGAAASSALLDRAFEEDDLFDFETL